MRKYLLAVMSVLAGCALLAVVPPKMGAAAPPPTAFSSCDMTQTTTTLAGTPTAGTAAVQVVALVAGTPIYVCGVTVVGASGTNPTFSLVYGTGTNCATGQKVFLPAIATTANVPFAFGGGRYLGAVPAGNALCYLDGGTTPVQNYVIVYAQS